MAWIYINQTGYKQENQDTIFLTKLAWTRLSAWKLITPVYPIPYRQTQLHKYTWFKNLPCMDRRKLFEIKVDRFTNQSQNQSACNQLDCLFIYKHLTKQCSRTIIIINKPSTIWWPGKWLSIDLQNDLLNNISWNGELQIHGIKGFVNIVINN